MSPLILNVSLASSALHVNESAVKCVKPRTNLHWGGKNVVMPVANSNHTDVLNYCGPEVLTSLVMNSFEKVFK